MWLALLCALGLAQSDPLPVRGLDVSLLPEVEDKGGEYRLGGKKGDLLEILAETGINTARLRLWVDPEDGYCDLDHTLAMAKRANKAGLDVLLNFHYSDWWADPGNQTMPKTWQDLSGEALEDKIRDYTRECVESLVEQGTPPKMVQLGNEIAGGFLWPHGRLEHDTPEKWRSFVGLWMAAREGVLQAMPDDPPQLIMHLECGGDAPRATWFMGRFREYGGECDAVGLSFYPWWHGTLSDLRQTIRGLRDDYDVLVMETAYPFEERVPQEKFADGRPIIPLHEGFAMDSDGQAGFLQAVVDLVREEGGIGVVYWGGEYVRIKGVDYWYDKALFGASGEPQPALWVLGGKRNPESD